LAHAQGGRIESLYKNSPSNRSGTVSMNEANTGSAAERMRRHRKRRRNGFIFNSSLMRSM
jgi:hypothetical protein